jgi:DNA-directed RNA polymerase specialized sigma24 family protein
MTDQPITLWIEGLKQGHSVAATGLWEQYFQRMVGLAQLKLGGLPRRTNDEEDVALSAFHSLCRGATKGNFPKLTDRESLWPLIALITARKAYDAINRDGRQKRGGGAVRSETDLASADGLPFILDQLLSREPTPADAVLLDEACDRMFAALAPAERPIVRMKLEGYTNNEIAEHLAVTPRTVERKLELIRKTWTKLAEQAGE